MTKAYPLFLIRHKLILLAAISTTLLFTTPSAAQGTPPPGGGDSPWAEILDENGKIQYGDLTDLGEIHEPADWMPNIPFIQGQATYHQYLAPSGNILVLPSAATLFFMALNPGESGLNQTRYSLGNGVGVLETMLAGYLSPNDLSNLGYSRSDDFWQDLIRGDVNIWTLDFMGDFMRDLLMLSVADQNLYTMLLLYTPGDCDFVPGGCPAGLEEKTKISPPSNACPAPYLTTGPIQITGGSSQGGKTAPPNPIVVGQDPEKRGVDLLVTVEIPRVVYHRFIQVAREEVSCARATSRLGNGCPTHPGDPNYRTVINTWVECIEETQQYEDRLASAQVSVSLTPASRQWILTHLAQAYPGANLVHPDFTFIFPGGGSSWSEVIPNIQTADPGSYAVNVSVRTTGTPVSAPRSASSNLGEFVVELVRVTLVGAP